MADVALTMADVTTHLRTDTVPDVYIDAAYDYVSQVTGIAYARFAPAPVSVNAAILLIVADLYEHRESQVEMQLYRNRTVAKLLAPYASYAR